MKVEPWNDGYTKEASAWVYEPPYDFYDLAADPPVDAAQWRAILGDDGTLEGFWYFDRHPDMVEVGIGLRPDLTGRGLGRAYMEAELAYAREHWRPRRFLLFVTEWNARAIRLYERLGFRETGREQRGAHEFIRMEAPA